MTQEFRTLTANDLKFFREDIKIGNHYCGNDYAYIQYKDGSVAVWDCDDTRDVPTNVNLRCVEYISLWCGKEEITYINPYTSKERVEQIKREFQQEL